MSLSLSLSLFSALSECLPAGSPDPSAPSATEHSALSTSFKIILCSSFSHSELTSYDKASAKFPGCKSRCAIQCECMKSNPSTTCRHTWPAKRIDQRHASYRFDNPRRSPIPLRARKEFSSTFANDLPIGSKTVQSWSPFGPWNVKESSNTSTYRPPGWLECFSSLAGKLSPVLNLA